MFENIKSKIANWGLKSSNTNDVVIEAVKRGGVKGDPLSRKIAGSSRNLRRKALKDWKLAVAAASDPENPDFSLLEELYQNLMLDAHLMSCIDSRVFKVQQSKFKIIDASGKENEDLTKLIEAKWFEDFIRIGLQTMFTGSSVCELWNFDEQFHLKAIETIDKRNLNLIKKLIVKEPGDTTGWNYEDNKYINYYLQIGKNADLGLLADLAPIILAKKLAIGSWLDFVEKFGIPARWVTTDREDTTRLNELFDMMMEMTSNHVAVLRGNEKIETEAVPNTDAHNVFNELIERMNSEISKRVLGATGTTDEKSFVGAAQVHQDVANDRHESDKSFIKNLINNELLQKLVLISPVYAQLANYSFEWDTTEDMSKADIIESVSKLSGFDFDIEELAKMTGLPIIAKTTTEQTGGSDEKK